MWISYQIEAAHKGATKAGLSKIVKPIMDELNKRTMRDAIHSIHNISTGIPKGRAGSETTQGRAISIL